MPNLNPNSTNYFHSFEPNTNDLTMAMDYNSAGQPVLRTAAGRSGTSSATAFGEPYAITITPVIQLDAIYGFDAYSLQEYTGSGGTTAYTNSQFICATDSTVGSNATIRSRKFLRYRPGQGVLIRGAAMYGTPAAGTVQRFGAFNSEEGYAFGYNGTQFGILHSYGGKNQIQDLLINSYSGLAQTLTITLNGTAFTVAISAGLTTSEVAAQIARATFTGWTAEQSDGNVIFLANSNGAKTGTYSVTSTGTISATFSTITVGVASTNEWIYQSTWNVDTVDGNGESKITINWQKFNILQIQMQWLGVGATTFSVQNPETGQMMPVHRQLWANNNTRMHVDNPNFKITMNAYSTGGTTPVTMTCGSWMGAVEGSYESVYFPRSRGVIKKTLASATVHHLISIQNPLVENGKINTREMRILDMSASVDSTDPVIFYLFVDSPLATGNQVFQPLPRTVADFSDATGTYDLTTQTPIVGFTIGVDGQGNFPLESFKIRIPPGMIAGIACYSESQIQKVSATFTWAKD